MFVPGKSEHLSCTVSSVSNNLSLLETDDQTIFASVHKTSVTLLMLSKDEKNATHRQVICKDPSSNSAILTITSTKLLSLDVCDVLVITSTHGLHIYDADGSSMIYWYSIKDGSGDSGEKGAFLKGIARLGSNYVCVGSHTGHVIMFKVTSSGASVKASFEGHCQPISELASGAGSARDLMVSGDEEGGLRTWILVGDKLQVKSKVPGGRGSVSDGWPVNSLAVWSEQNSALAGYGSGVVRVFDMINGRVLMEIFAHSRLISALDWSPEHCLLLTASEDTMFRVFRLESGSTGAKDVKVTLIQSEVIKDQMLQGARFRKNGRTIHATAFDSEEIFTFNRK